jgi:hypothetical protein
MARVIERADSAHLEALTGIRNPSRQAYRILHIGFVLLPVVAGLDKFFDLLGPWHEYLAPILVRLAGGEAHRIMYPVGVIEIVAGLLVWARPRIGAYVVAAWLAGIIVNLLLIPGYFDIALRDFGLLLGALALGRLAEVFERRGRTV